MREYALAVEMSESAPDSPTRIDVLVRARSDARAMAEAYEQFRLPVYRYLRTRVLSDDEAADLTAETFVRAIRAIGTYRGSGSAIGWLLRIARNAAIDAERHNRHDMPLVAVASADPLAVSAQAPEEALLAAERVAELRAAVAALPEPAREGIALRYAAGLSTREIAGVLGKSDAATQKLISRALAALREDHHVDR